MKAKKILIVEDDKMLSTVFKMFVQELGYELLGVFPDGRQAIDKCKEVVPDIILMDIYLKGDLDGIVTTTMIQDTWDIPVIFISSVTDKATIQRVLQTKSYGFLVKPVDKTELGIAIELALIKHKFDKNLWVSEERYRTLIQDSPDAVIVFTNGNIDFVNFSGLKLFGTIHIEDMIGLPVGNLITDECRDEFNEKINSALEKTGKIELRSVKIKTLRDRVITAEIIGSVISFKGDKSVQLIIRDISESLKSKNVLAEQDNIIGNIYDGVITMSLGGIVKYFNSGAERIFGIQKSNIIGKHISGIFPEKPVLFIQENFLEPTLEKEHHDLESEFTNLVSNQMVYVHFSLSTLRNLNNETTGIVCNSRNITKRKLAEKKLAETEERFKMLSLTSTDAYWDWNVKTNEVFYSPKFKELLGYSENEIRNHMEEWDARIHPDDKKMVSTATQEHLDGKTPFYSVEYRMKHRNGNYIWIMDRGIALRDDNGDSIRMIGALTEVTETKNAEELIKTSEANLKAIFNANREAIFLADKNFRVLDMNKNAKLYSQKLINREISVGSNVSEILFFINKSDLNEYFVNTLEGGITHRLERVIKLDTVDVSFEISIYPILDDFRDEITRFCISLLDITNRKAIEKDLKETRAELKPLFDSSIQRFYLSDLSYTLVAFNKAAQETIKDELGKVIKKGDSVLDLLPNEEEKEMFLQRFAAAKKGEHIVFKEKLKRNGVDYWVETHIEPISNEKGEIIRVLIWTLDITKEKQAEVALIENQKKYYTLFSEANDAILLIDHDADSIVDCNEKAEELFGYSKEKFLTIKAINLAPDVQSDGITSALEREKIIKEAQQGKNRTFLWKYKKSDGTLFDAEVSLSMFMIGHRNFRHAIVRDITTRLNIEKSLKESEQKNKSLLTAIPDQIFIFNNRGVYMDCKADNEDLLPFPKEKLLGKNISDVFAGDKLLEIRNKIERILHTQTVETVEYLLLLPAGERWFEARLAYLNDKEILALARDITRRKNTEESLRISEQKTKSLIQAIPDLIFVIDNSGLYKDFMVDSEDTFTVHPEKIIGSHLDKYFSGQKLEEFHNKIKKALETKKLQTLDYELDSSIGIRWFEARLTYMNESEVFVLVRDITDTRNAIKQSQN